LCEHEVKRETLTALQPMKRLMRPEVLPTHLLLEPSLLLCL